MTMVEEHYNNRHRSTNWKVSQPIEDWYHQSIRDLSGLGIDENRMNRKWKKVVRKGYEEAAEKEQKAAGKVNLERMGKEKGYPHHRHRHGRGRRKSYYEPSDCSCDDESSDSTDSCYCQPKPSKSIYLTKKKEKEKEKEKDHPKGKSRWKICRHSPGNCSLEHKWIKCNGLCGLTACLEKEHRMHKTYSEIECTEPNCKNCKRAKEKQEEREKEKTPPYEEKKVHCTCGYRYCKHKVFEIEEIAKPPMPRYFFNK